MTDDLSHAKAMLHFVDDEMRNLELEEPIDPTADQSSGTRPSAGCLRALAYFAIVLVGLVPTAWNQPSAAVNNRRKDGTRDVRRLIEKHRPR